MRLHPSDQFPAACTKDAPSYPLRFSKSMADDAVVNRLTKTSSLTNSQVHCPISILAQKRVAGENGVSEGAIRADAAASLAPVRITGRVVQDGTIVVGLYKY